RVLDLEGQMVLPGLIESHAHPGPTDPPGVETWEPGLYAGMLVESDNPEDVIAQLKDFVDENIRPHLTLNESGVPTPYEDELVMVQLIGNPEPGMATSSIMQGWMRVPTDTP